MRAVSCCEQIRISLGCSLNPAEPCRGFSGACADIREQFKDLDGLMAADGTLADLAQKCTSFPDPDFVSDRIVMGLIMVAVAFPTKLILQIIFESSNEMKVPQSWMRFDGALALICGRMNWRLSHPQNPHGYLKRLYGVLPARMCLNALLQRFSLFRAFGVSCTSSSSSSTAEANLLCFRAIA